MNALFSISFIIVALLIFTIPIGIKLLLEKNNMESPIGFIEPIAGILIFSLGVVIGTNAFLSSIDNYKEYWNGIETNAYVDVVDCKKDGRCKHSYNCDPYTVAVTKTRTVSDGKGGTRTESYVENETRYRSCPYVNQEFSYYINDSLDNTYTIGKNLFPDNPENNRWTGYGYKNRKLPNVESGVPEFWVKAKNRIDSGKPGGTTVQVNYDNYILPAQETVYRKYSDKIDHYKENNLLPQPVKGVREPYLADKLYVVGLELPNYDQWSEKLMRFNGFFGSEKQGDLHLILVDSNKVNKDDYPLAVEAYWQSKELGKHTLSKNGVVVIAGINGNTVEWVNGFTGMPNGNEKLLADVSTLKLDYSMDGFLSEDSPLTQVLFDDYVRVEMKDYEYLKSSLEIAGWHKFIVYSVSLFLSVATMVIITIVRNNYAAPQRKYYNTQESNYYY